MKASEERIFGVIFVFFFLEPWSQEKVETKPQIKTIIDARNAHWMGKTLSNGFLWGIFFIFAHCYAINQSQNQPPILNM